MRGLLSNAKSAVLAIWLMVLAPAHTGIAGAAQPLVRAIDSVSVTVSDMDRSVAFYHLVLSFEPVSDIEVAGDNYEHLYGVFGARIRIVKLRLGDEYLNLEQFIAPRGRPVPADSKSNDGWFQHIAIIVGDMDRAFAWLHDHRVEFSSPGPQLLPLTNPNAGGIAAFYFRDPDGHNLEILHFPPDKGASKWQARSDRLFLGIDHSAIVVGDSEASLRYYRDTLGLRVAGSSENFGIEQERLNNVFGARLRITALRAESGPGIELLEYLAPHTGRPMPVDTQANDLWNWHVDMRADVVAAENRLHDRHVNHVSAGPIDSDPNVHRWSLLLRDPDGHATMLQSQ